MSTPFWAVHALPDAMHGTAEPSAACRIVGSTAWAAAVLLSMSLTASSKACLASGWIMVARGLEHRSGMLYPSSRSLAGVTKDMMPSKSARRA